MKKYLTLRMIKELSEEQLKLVKSETWKNGERRCETVGIYNISVEDAAARGLGREKLSWSEEHGDPTVYLTLDEEIRRSPNDNWEFSLSVVS